MNTMSDDISKSNYTGNLQSMSGDITCHKCNGSFSTMSGDINLVDCTITNAETMSGDITIQSSGADYITSVSGDIKLIKVKADLVTTVSGTINLNSSDIKNVTCKYLKGTGTIQRLTIPCNQTISNTQKLFGVFPIKTETINYSNITIVNGKVKQDNENKPFKLPDTIIVDTIISDRDIITNQKIKIIGKGKCIPKIFNI